MPGLFYFQIVKITRSKIMQKKSLNRLNRFAAWGKTGNPDDVDALMRALITRGDLATSKLVDYALSLVDTRKGVARLKHYLFNGVPVQRNYAALYFKRKGYLSLLDDAVAQGKIDHQQAYAK
jgi:hypothetical protein